MRLEARNIGARRLADSIQRSDVGLRTKAYRSPILIER